MNPPNPFGSPQSGAFQATNSTIKTGLFGQSFGQQNPSSLPPAMGFFTPSAFGQPASQGGAMFGSGPLFGGSTSSSLPGQTPAFGQPQVGVGNSGLGGDSAPTFGQIGGPGQGSVFGQKPAFGQPSAFGQASGFGQPPPAYGEHSGFGKTSLSSGPATTMGQPQPRAFGQPLFGQPSSAGASTVFSSSSTQSKDFSTGFEFSFKPANEALFKPIFNASPEPQTTSPFSATSAQTKSITMSTNTTATNASGFSLPKTGSLGFNFSQPAAVPSISAQNNPSTTGDGGGTATSTLQFTFSQPATLTSTTKSSSTQQPTTPSTFSFSTKTPQTQAAPLFGAVGTGTPAGVSDVKPKEEEEGAKGDLESIGDTSVFGRLGKGTKRKEDPGFPAAVEAAAEDDEVAERQPPKRPLVRSRGPAGAPRGLFGKALSDLRRDMTPPARREVKEMEAVPEPEEVQAGAVGGQEGQLTATLPLASTLARDGPTKTEESEPAQTLEPKLENTATPAKRRDVHKESTESLGGLSPSDCTAIQCRDLPLALNKKDILDKHFSRFGKVRRVFCRPGKNMAIVHFDNHVSAAKAKKRGKMLHKHELLLLWQRKKQSPGDKGSRPRLEKEEGEIEEDTNTKSTSFPLRRPALRVPAATASLAFSRSSPVKKQTIVKSLQFDSDTQKEGPADAQSSEHPVPSSLLHLIGQVAETSEDKYRFLEQRDKILRQGRPKCTDLDLSKVFVGTCPDMCPEKERYMRETQNQLSTYELIPGTERVNHTAAIKEYSRSSADQEEPLPHELRPLLVLSVTMDYLVIQIMDQGQDNYRDWYDFVWNRTRGVRKDITQQRLCCPSTVSLIEKCTRFHVHCAHHLCEEHMSVFDAKINNENMTKCLQSLKEMYEDLRTRQIYCPLEAEFRQYSVLLKLNDSDILCEVQQFREEVRNSAEVKFAVQAFAAVNNNNFVRFFKLVKGASYLAGCLLHRYFNQVRGKALKSLNMAHTGPRSTTFPVEDVVRMLMFRDAAEATTFIQQYGLSVNDGLVELNRVACQEPDPPLSQRKSEVIIAKKAVLIGEVVNGGSLPRPPQHTPVCSFDSQHKYRGESHRPEPAKIAITEVAVRVLPSAKPLSQAGPPVLTPNLPAAAGSGFSAADPAETGEPYAAPGPDGKPLFQPQPQPVKLPPAPAPQPAFSDKDIMAEVDAMIDEVVEAEVMEVSAEGASYAAAALEESSMQVESLLTEVTGRMLREVSAAELCLERERVAEEKRKLEEARRKQEHENFLVQFSFSLCSELIKEVLDEAIEDTAASQYREAVDEKAERVARCTQQVSDALLEETLAADIMQLAEEVLEAELQRIHKYIKRWRDVVAVRRQLKRQMRGFPAAPCCVDPRFKLKALAPSAPTRHRPEHLARGLVDLGNAGTLALSSTRLLKMKQEVIHQMRVHCYYQQLLDEVVWAPLDLPALVAEHLPDAPERIFWKAVLLLPSDDESVASVADRILSDWLEVKFGGDPGSEAAGDGALQTLTVSSGRQESKQCSHAVHVSVKASRGPLSEDSLCGMEERCELQGTTALIMLLPALRAGHDEHDVPLLSALLQLKQLQQASAWHHPLPLVVLVPGPEGDDQRLSEDLRLHALVDDGLISEYCFLYIPETTRDLQGSRQLGCAVRWLLARAPQSSSLCCRTLVQLVEAALSCDFSPRILSQRQERASAGLPPLSPAPVIGLYNAILARLSNHVASSDLANLSWPPSEFCLADTRESVPPLGWNSAPHLAWLREVFLNLQLPPWIPTSPTSSWGELLTAVLRYAGQVSVSCQSRPLLTSRLENLLERCRIKAHRAGMPAGPRVPWDDILVTCIDHKLKDWQFPGPPPCEDAVTEDGEILIYFPTEPPSDFQLPDEWTEAVKQTHQESKWKDDEGASAAISFTARSASLRQRLFHSLLETPESPAAPPDISHSPSADERLVHRVLQSLDEEKAKSRRSLDQLQLWLDGNTLDHWSTSLFVPSSTLLSAPGTAVYSPEAADSALAKTLQAAEPTEVLDVPGRPRATPVSLERRLKELERRIAASREEELTCRLKLNGMMSIVDD